MQVSRTYADLLNGGGSFSPLSKSVGSPEGRNLDGTPKVNACRRILGQWSGGSALSPGPERRELVEKLIFLPGYNTNYCASWWLARSGVTLDQNGNVFSPGGHTPISTLERHCTLGPLMRARLDASGVASSIVPLLADAAPTTQFLSDNLGDITGGQLLGHAMTRGPVQPATMKPPSGISGPPSMAWAVWNATLQDYRQFGTPHSRSCQIAFADGSVRAFIDETKDGALNNGFPGTGTNGYSDGTVELPPNDVFSRWRLSHE